MRAGVRESQGRPPGRQLAAPGSLLPPRRRLGLPAAPRWPHSRREVVGVNEEEEDSEQGKGNIDPLKLAFGSLKMTLQKSIEQSTR